MLSENEIQQALHASRVVALHTANPHGPLGLEQLAAEVGVIRGERRFQSVVVPLAPETWDKLQRLAASARQSNTKLITSADLVREIVERYLASVPS